MSRRRLLPLLFRLAVRRFRRRRGRSGRLIPAEVHLDLSSPCVVRLEELLSLEVEHAGDEDCWHRLQPVVVVQHVSVLELAGEGDLLLDV